MMITDTRKYRAREMRRRQILLAVRRAERDNRPCQHVEFPATRDEPTDMCDDYAETGSDRCWRHQ